MRRYIGADAFSTTFADMPSSVVLMMCYFLFWFQYPVQDISDANQ
jgi:hypothetical protein